MRMEEAGGRIVAAMIVTLIGLLLGIGAGRIYREMRRHSAATKLRTTQQLYLEQNIRGIELGRPFPDVPLQDIAGRAVLPRDYLSSGGILVFTASDCGSCFEAVSALDAAVRRIGADQLSILIVAVGDLPPLLEYMSNESIDLRVVSDGQRSLADQYGVGTFPCVFTVDSLQIVRSIAAGMRTEDEFITVLSGK
jgi:peroxiredoxin